jgi:hypothetical protein
MDGGKRGEWRSMRGLSGLLLGGIGKRQPRPPPGGSESAALLRSKGQVLGAAAISWSGPVSVAGTRRDCRKARDVQLARPSLLLQAGSVSLPRTLEAGFFLDFQRPYPYPCWKGVPAAKGWPRCVLIPEDRDLPQRRRLRSPPRPSQCKRKRL